MFWQATNQIIATYDYTGPYNYEDGPPTNFQAIPFLLLSAGQPYSISTQNSNFTDMMFIYAYANNGYGGTYPYITPFTNSPYISQFASYYISSSGEWTSTANPPWENTNALALGPNFRFQPLTLSIINISMVGGYPQLSIQSNIGITNQIQWKTSLSQSNWVVLTNLLVAQSPYSFIDVSTATTSSRFYWVMVLTNSSSAAPSVINNREPIIGE